MVWHIFTLKADYIGYNHTIVIADHQDLKADNLLLDLDGVCKISDFGISKQSSM
jgi:mitogen-activated protein kinase kinase kinase